MDREKLLLDLAKEASGMLGDTKELILQAFPFTNGVNPLHDRALKRLERISKLIKEVYK